MNIRIQLIFGQSQGKVDLYYETLKNGKFLIQRKNQSLRDIKLEEKLILPIPIKAPKETGKYYLKFR